MLERKRTDLLSSIAHHVEGKINFLTEQRKSCTSKLNATAALVDYTDEVMKEKDSATFLMISSSLCARLV